MASDRSSSAGSLPAEASATSSVPSLSSSAVTPNLRRLNLHPETIFDASNERIREEILVILAQHLKSEGYTATYWTLQEEASLRQKERLAGRNHARKLRKAILDGDWVEAERLCVKPQFRQNKGFLFQVYRQQFLEVIERQEYQKALTILTKKLKPLESFSELPDEIRELSYLLTCRTVRESGSYSHWPGTHGGREELVASAAVLSDSEREAFSPVAQLESGRLVSMLKQAVAYQVHASRYQPEGPVVASSILEDFQCFVLPNRPRAVSTVHSCSVDALCFAGQNESLIVVGSADGSLSVHDVESGTCLHFEEKSHKARVWDVASSRSGKLVVSGGSHGQIRLWSVETARADVSAVRGGGADSPPVLFAPVRSVGSCRDDIYAVHVHPHESHFLAAGCDTCVRIFSRDSGEEVRDYRGHSMAVTCAQFSPSGSMVASGGKDRSIHVWDIVSGSSLTVLRGHLADVSGLAFARFGTKLASSGKDNTVRLWDLRERRAVSRFKGHQHTLKSFIRPSFGAEENVIFCGSEDGRIVAWDVRNERILRTLSGHKGPVYRAEWNRSQTVLASCAQDGVVNVWDFVPPVPRDDGASPSPPASET